jgi:hypothetical protein
MVHIPRGSIEEIHNGDRETLEDKCSRHVWKEEDTIVRFLLKHNAPLHCHDRVLTDSFG